MDRGWTTGAAAWSVIFFIVGWTVGANVSSRLLDTTTGIRVMTLGWLVGSVEPVRRLLAGDEVDDLARNVTLDDVAEAVRDGYGAATVVALAVMSVAFVPMIRLLRRDERARDLAEPGDSATAADRKAT